MADLLSGGAVGAVTGEVLKYALQTIQNGKELVRKSKKLNRWKFFRFPRYKTKLQKKDEELKRHLNVNVQVENRRDLMDVLIKVNEILEFIMTMRKENLVGAQIWGLSGNQIWGLWGAPEEPVCVVGMNEPLNNLKIELIKDGVSVHVLTGFGGSGKTTLVKKLCWDSQIKDSERL
ncbi:unnamed protein product [Trifolium pratense]|uniref:Uncharacterized protein n=1 Tax=Trifolium pratense TaxID=57577 RepID=A0ACB0LMA1_TRIPR|nr:unnamed protein product [Trifolium pratense]